MAHNVEQAVPGLYGGISEQHVDLRLSTQCEEQINLGCSPILGLYKRNGIEATSGTDINATGLFVFSTAGRDFAIAGFNGTSTGWRIYEIGSNPDNNYNLIGRSIINPESITFGTVFRRKCIPVDGGIMVMDMDTRASSTNRLAQTTIYQYYRDISDALEDAATDRIVGVVGDGGTDATTSYYKFKQLTVTAASSNWVAEETYYEQFSFNINAVTLLYNTDGTFTLRRVNWDAPRVGNLYSAPPPEFLGTLQQIINNNRQPVLADIVDAFIYRSRLFICHTNGINCSRVGRFTDFFPESVRNVTDEDPFFIPVQAGETIVGAAPFNQSLIIFTTTGQYIIKTEGNLSANTVAIANTTKYRVNRMTYPVNVGAKILFCSENKLMEYYTEGLTTVDAAIDLSETTENLIQFTADMIHSERTKQVFIMNSETSVATASPDCHELIVYSYMDYNQQKLQSAFYRYRFAHKILGFALCRDALFFLFRSDETGQYRIGRLLLLPDESPKLDYKTEVAVQASYYNAASNLTVIPFGASNFWNQFYFTGTRKLIDADSYEELSVVWSETIDNAFTGTVVGDFTGRRLILGLEFPAAYRFSPQVYRNADTGVRIMGTNTFYRHIYLHLENTGGFDLVSTYEDRDERHVQTFDNSRYYYSRLGETNLTTNLKQQFSLVGDVLKTKLDIEATNHFPFKLNSVAFKLGVNRQTELR